MKGEVTINDYYEFGNKVTNRDNKHVIRLKSLLDENNIHIDFNNLVYTFDLAPGSIRRLIDKLPIKCESHGFYIFKTDKFYIICLFSDELYPYITFISKID